MTPAACPGPCNNAWRRAEEILAANGTEHELQPTWGHPVHCQRCVDRTREKLEQLPALLTAVRTEPLDGTTTNLASTAGHHGITAVWPGQAARLLTDRIVGEMAVLQVDILVQRSIWHPDTEPSPGTMACEDRHISRIVTALGAHWDWAMQNHPAAGESYDRGSANPGSQATGWWSAATYFVKDHRQPPAERLAPCPRCRGPWLAECSDLRLVNDRPYIECRDEICGNIMTGAEYDRYVKEMTGAIRRAKV